MKDVVRKTPEQISDENARIERLRQELLKLTDMCPDSVLNGFHGTVVQWKSSAIKARRLAESKSPTLTKLENMLTELRPYYKLHS